MTFILSGLLEISGELMNVRNNRFLIVMHPCSYKCSRRSNYSSDIFVIWWMEDSATSNSHSRFLVKSLLSIWDMNTEYYRQILRTTIANQKNWWNLTVWFVIVIYLILSNSSLYTVQNLSRVKITQYQSTRMFVDIVSIR